MELVVSIDFAVSAPCSHKQRHSSVRGSSGFVVKEVDPTHCSAGVLAAPLLTLMMG